MSNTPVPSTPNETTPAEAPRKRRPPRRVTVTRIQTLSPLMRRITLQGEELDGFDAPEAASYIKLIFPEPGQTEPDRPLPDAPRPKAMRTYTPQAVRTEAREVDVDFVLHGVGPASTWAAQAAVGQVIYLMGPGPGYKQAVEPGPLWLVGDDSALPAFETILSRQPENADVKVLVEVVDAAESRDLPSPANVTAEWLPRGSDNTKAGHALEAALRTGGAPPADARIYLACEAGAMRRLRLLLINDLGVDKTRIVGRGYWKLETANHPDHDYGDDA